MASPPACVTPPPPPPITPGTTLMKQPYLVHQPVLSTAPIYTFRPQVLLCCQYAVWPYFLVWVAVCLRFTAATVLCTGAVVVGVGGGAEKCCRQG